MEQFTIEDLKNLQVFLQRVQLNGSEAIILVLLQNKIAQLLTPAKDELKTTSETTSS